MKPVESPHHDGRKYNHPAFGQVTVSRVSGKSYLYGSDFQHHQYVVVSLYTSEEIWTNSRPWYFQDKPVASFAMTEAQWATFVSSFNMGAGVPCTLERMRDGDMAQLPRITPAVPVADQFKREYKQTVADSLKAMHEALALARQRKVHSSIINAIETSIRELDKNVPFVETLFSEHVEGLVEEAKVEANAYLDQTLKSLGMEAIREDLQVSRGPGPLRILNDDGSEGYRPKGRDPK